ncbi:MAG: tRNA pseudouridine(38-40) synthase TruA [Thermomicrobiaceae bacterium]
MTDERHVRIDLGYDGRAFYGSQRQANVRTVQAELETAVARITGKQSRLALAGRTDRGVHAVGQVASLTVLWQDGLERLRYGIDSVTPDDLVIFQVRDVGPEFHARFSAKSREYRYRVFASERAPVAIAGHVWHLKTRLLLDELNRASEWLLGRQDFRSFAGAGLGTENSQVGTCRSIEVAAWRQLSGDLEPDGELFEFRVRANAFLPHMVRNLVGALIRVGNSEHDVNWFKRLLDERNRKQSPPAAPAHGLTLWSVAYDDRELEQIPGQDAGLEQE